jgi:hypothetical protein
MYGDGVHVMIGSLDRTLAASRTFSSFAHLPSGAFDPASLVARAPHLRVLSSHVARLR